MNADALLDTGFPVTALSPHLITVNITFHQCSIIFSTPQSLATFGPNLTRMCIHFYIPCSKVVSCFPPPTITL